MQEQQEVNQTGQGKYRQATEQAAQQNNGTAKGLTVRNNLSIHNLENQQATAANKYKRTSIESMLPSPKTANIISIDAGYTDEVSGGMDGGCKDIATNLQDGATKGGISVMLCMRDCILTLVQMIEPSIVLITYNNKGNNKKFSSRCRTETPTNRLPRKIKRNNNLEKE